MYSALRSMNAIVASKSSSVSPGKPTRKYPTVSTPARFSRRRIGQVSEGDVIGQFLIHQHKLVKSIKLPSFRFFYQALFIHGR